MSYTDGIKIRTLTTIRGLSLGKDPRLMIEEGVEVDAVSNPYGAISGICKNGERLGIYPSEFEFIVAPEWVLRIWVQHRNRAGDSALALLRAGGS